MVRAAPTPSKKKEKEAAVLTAEDKAEEAESKRLRELAFSRRLISRSRSHAHHPSLPSKTILSSDGRDIAKKGHRKSKYLFAFPGLLSPIAGGKLGELTNLDSKNPILYFEFPQGRLKLFGTITYPKNKYLTLHFPRGSGNIVCEDCFESIIVFSQAWWIGTKEQNPEEVRLPLPKSFEQEKNDEVDFMAGAGAGQGMDVSKSRHQLEKSEAIPQTSLMAKPEISEAKITTAAMKANIRSGKRSRNFSEGHSEGSDSDIGDNDIYVLEASPSKRRKLNKTEPGVGTTKVSTPTRKFSSVSKVQGQDLSVKNEEEKQKRASKEKPSEGPSGEPASTTKARKSALKSRKSYTESSDTEDEEAESDDTNDDSDEDYVG